MTADQSLKILVVILSTTLAIALVLAIIVLVKTIQILKYVKQIVKKADDLADKAEDVADQFTKTFGSMTIIRLISSVSEVFKRKNK